MADKTLPKDRFDSTHKDCIYMEQAWFEHENPVRSWLAFQTRSEAFFLPGGEPIVCQLFFDKDGPNFAANADELCGFPEVSIYHSGHPRHLFTEIIHKCIELGWLQMLYKFSKVDDDHYPYVYSYPQGLLSSVIDANNLLVWGLLFNREDPLVVTKELDVDHLLTTLVQKNFADVVHYLLNDIEGPAMGRTITQSTIRLLIKYCALHMGYAPLFKELFPLTTRGWEHTGEFLDVIETACTHGQLSILEYLFNDGEFPILGVDTALVLCTRMYSDTHNEKTRSNKFVSSRPRTTCESVVACVKYLIDIAKDDMHQCNCTFCKERAHGPSVRSTS